MDWLDSMATYAQSQAPNDGGPADEEDEDFYGYSHGSGMNGVHKNGTARSDTVTGAAGADTNHTPSNAANEPQPVFPATPGSIPPTHPQEGQAKPGVDEQKLENQRKTEELRAKLLAQRQNTPVKQVSRVSTPVRSTNAVTKPVPPPTTEPATAKEIKEPSSEITLDTLLAEGKAAAEAKQKEQPRAAPASPSVLPLPQQNEVLTKLVQQDSNVEPTQIQEQSNQEHPVQINLSPEENARPTNLANDYYADLPIWLELTGYHDAAYRDSKLRTFKERRALEAEAARIHARLKTLKEEEQLDAQALRKAPAHITAPAVNAPFLPSTMPRPSTSKAPDLRNGSMPNGTKRARSPEPEQALKSRREDATNDFRIRGANGSPEQRPPPRGRPRSRSPAVGGALAQYISYSGSRRVSLESASRPVTNVKHEDMRDPSLERRQTYYERNFDVPLFSRDGHDQSNGRNVTRSGYDNRSRLNQNRPSDAPFYRGEHDHYPSRSSLDLRRGGARYFMIKSWNHGNIAEAMQDSLWATQVKNESILADAYNTSRHVILLFSVNQSRAFQGYALMDSAFDPTLPKPSFCAKLKWATSPAFRLRWLARTPVHFRWVGHIKNPLNLGDDGQPLAVLVGKDGQEISPEAGLGVVEILDEVEEAERKKAHNADGDAGRV